MFSSLTVPLFGRKTEKSTPTNQITFQEASSIENQTQENSKTDRGRLKSGIRDYDRSIRALEGKSHPTLTDELFWYQEFRSGSHTDSFAFTNGETFGVARQKLQNALESATDHPPSTLQLFVLSTTPVSPDILSWFGQVIATNLGRLSDFLIFPRTALASDVEHRWNGLSDCTFKSIERPHQLVKVEALSLPECREQFLSHSTANCRCKEYQIAPITNHFDRRPVKDTDAHFFGFKKKAIPAFPYKLTIELPSQGRGNQSFVSKALIEQCARLLQRQEASFSFAWQRAAPKYHGGFDTFLWERHSHPPECDYAEIHYQNDTNTTGARRVFMTLSTTPHWLDTTSLLKDLKSALRENPTDDNNMWPFMENLSKSQGTSDFLMLPLFVVFEQIVKDTVLFLQRASDEILKISYAGRSASSVEKIQYLCHLDDCRESSLLGLRHVLAVIDSLLPLLSQLELESTPTSILPEFLQDKRKDVEFLIEELNGSLRDHIKDNSDEIRQHRELAQTRKTSMLTYIATIYVPFSFLTGMLSMQVTNPAYFFHPSTKPQPTDSSGNTSNAVVDVLTSSVASIASTTAIAARQATSSASTTAVVNATTTGDIYALLSSQLAAEIAVNSSVNALGDVNAPLNNNAAHVWPFGLFLGLAIFLFFSSLLLPLVGPNILRILVQRSYKIRNLWVFWPIVFILYYTIVYWAIPESIAAYLKCGDVGVQDPGGWCTAWNSGRLNDSSGYGYFYTENFDSAAENPINTITFIFSAIVMGSIALFQITLAIMYRRGASKTLMWLTFAAVVVFVYMMDWFYPTEQYYPFAIGSGLSISAIVPLAYLIVVWSVPPIMGWWKKRRSATRASYKEKVG